MTTLQALAIGVLTGGLLLSNPTRAQLTPSAKKAARVRITQGPEIELAKDRLTTIRRTTNNPGGSPEHYGVVHYGEDPKNLTQMVKSHIRLNQGHRFTIFRVRLDDPKPRTRYYYSVDSMDARGTTDGVISPVKTFRTHSASK